MRNTEQDNLKYQKLYHWAHTLITSGVIKNMDKFPSETILQKKFGYSRQTVRTALQQLEDEGLITRVRGSGTYVSYEGSTENMDEKLGKKGMLHMYRRTKDCTAMIVYNDEVAGYYMEFLADRGLSVPEDVSVVSFDDAELQQEQKVKLLSAVHPKYQLGRITAKNLLRMMEDENWQERNYSYRFPVKLNDGNSVRAIDRR